MSGEENGSLLAAHFQRMQDACANYVEPTTYHARHPDLDSIGDCRWVREFDEPRQGQSDVGKANAKHRRDQAFINDMIYMLDGPEQRAAQAALTTPTTEATPAPDHGFSADDLATVNRLAARMGGRFVLNDGSLQKTQRRLPAAEPATGANPAQVGEPASAGEVGKILYRIRRSAEMSANIMRDARRTGGWEGAENTARQFDRLAKDAREATAALATPSPTDESRMREREYITLLNAMLCEVMNAGGDSVRALRDACMATKKAIAALNPAPRGEG